MKNTYEKEEKRFGAFLKEKRLKHGIKLEQLSEGLCSASGLARIEAGTRTVPKALQDSLLYRLGVSPDSYENFVFEEDYIRWKKRQRLLYAASRGGTEDAAGLLGEYREQYEAGAEKEAERRLERQFCLAMEAQILRNQSGPEEAGAQGRLGNLFREALALTVEMPLPSTAPDGAGEAACRPPMARSIRGKICSVQELNLLLETVRYAQPPDWRACFGEILELAEHPRFDTVSRAKIHPKGVYYLCREGLARGTWGMAEKTEAAALCGKAVSCLREAGRMYYLWELLGLLRHLLRDAAAGQRAAGAEGKAQELEGRIPEYEGWAEALEAVCGEFGVPRETRDCCWLYVEKEVYCINEVIRARREMLGLSRRQLCDEGILCSEKTLRRLEEGGKKIQKGILEELMERLKLTAEYCRTELITKDPEALELMSRIRDKIRNWESGEADLLLEQLRERISLEIPFNRQLWMNCHIINEAHKGSITKEECVAKLREILAITLPYETVVKPGKKYLTNQEINCIQNMAVWNKGMDEEKKKQIALLEGQYAACKKEKNIFCFINMYEIVMDCVASELGNMGEYDRSDEISRTIITECLYQRRTFGVHRGIYGLMWNDEQRLQKGIPVCRRQNPEEDLKHCIAFSQLGTENRQEAFYRKKLHDRESL